MYRLLIVDDEPFIVDGLYHLFTSAEHLELEVMRAYSTEEALNWLNRTKIDIVLSDIRMPGMNGLQLQKEINRHWPRCKVIFLTGHDDFDYIHEATREGVVAYVLKTEGNEVVMEIVEKTVRALTKEWESNQMIDKARQQMQAALPSLQRQFLLDLLTSDSKSFSGMKRQFAELGIPLSEDLSSLMLVGRIDNWKEEMSSYDRALLLYAVQNIFEELMAPATRLMPIVFDHARLLWIVQPRMPDGADAQEEMARTVRFVHGTVEQVQSVCHQLLKLEISFAVAGEAAPWERLSIRFEALKSLLNSGLGIGKQLLLVEPSGPTDDGRPGKPTEGDYAVRILLKKSRLLASCLDNGERDSFFDLYYEIMRLEELSSQDRSNALRLQVYYSLVSIFMPHVNQLGKPTADVDLHLLTRMEDHRSWHEVTDYFSELAKRIFDRKLAGKDEQEHEVIQRVKRYVEHNISEDVSLVQIGEAVGHNPSYLSRLYKNITGQGISELIHDIRLAKAKDMLRQHKYKINDVAESIGFLSSTNFYRFFKKATDMTPQEYRDSQTSK